jgi:hypothetical protein
MFPANATLAKVPADLTWETFAPKLSPKLAQSIEKMLEEMNGIQ